MSRAIKSSVFSVFLVAAILGVSQDLRADCGCTVTSSTGSGKITEECTLHKLILSKACPTVTISDTLSGKKGTADAPVEIKLNVAIELKKSLTGPELVNGKPVVKLSYGSATSDMLVDMKGNVTLSNVAVTAPGKTAIKVSGTNNTIENTTISASKVAIELDANATANHFFNGNSFTGNSAAIVLNGGNSNIPAPLLIRAIYKGSLTHYTFLVSAIGGVKAYRADAAAAAQGVVEVGTVEKLSGNYCDGELCYFKIKVDGIESTTDLVLISDSNAGTTAFSEKVRAADSLDEAPENCMDADWFVKSAIKLYPSASSVWKHDLDGDKFTNGQEDKDHNCVIEKANLESDPGNTEDTPFVFSYVNLCLINKMYCAPIFPIDPKKTDGIKDADQDGKLDDKDNCPMASNPDQADYDNDGLGNVCDPDADNDGLSNKYCDPGQSFKKEDQAKGNQCILVGVDQEGAVNAVKDPTAGSVNLNSLDADSDGDDYCDGPGFGPIVDGKAACLPSDNCPLNSNEKQWDTDEDGIGNDCDASKENAFTPSSDSDGDGAKDWQANGKGDNCPWIANKDQLDTDSDGRGDVCDSDDDNDAVLDVVENSTRYFLYDKTSGALAKIVMLNPKSAASDADMDGKGDNYPDNTDKCPVISGGTDKDACDQILASQYKAVVNDGASDDCPTFKNLGMKGAGGKDMACDANIDGDGVANVGEDKLHTHFWEPDSDHYKFNKLGNEGYGPDGFKDGEDLCPANYGKPNTNFCADKTDEPDADKDGVPDSKDNCLTKSNPEQSNLDSDKLGDVCDDDIDGDTKPNDGDKCPKDPKDACEAGPGITKDPPKTLPGPENQSFQGGGGGCSLVTNTTPDVAPIVLVMFAALLVFRLRRSY